MRFREVLGGFESGPPIRDLFGQASGPIAGAILGLLAYKACEGMNQRKANFVDDGSSTASGGGGVEVLQGKLRNRLQQDGGLAGVLSGGLGQLVKQFEQAGYGDNARHWVSTGARRPISPADLSIVLTEDQFKFLMETTGLSREEVLDGLSRQLPKAIDELTPKGHIPAEHEVAEIVAEV